MNSTRVSALKRPLKKIRNLFKDPLPRNRELVFENYELRFPDIVFFYRVSGVRYESVVSFDLPVETLGILNRKDHHPLFVNLGLSFAAAHFLLGDFAVVCCECAKLDQQDIELQEAQLLGMLAEFRFLLGLDPSRRVKVRSTGTIPLTPVPVTDLEENALMLNGGGKDSCVSAELLRGVEMPYAWVSAFPNATRRRVIERSGVLEQYSFRFSMSKLVTKDAAYPWGVQPYMYTIAAASLIIGYLKRFRYIVTGSEHSSEEPNLVFKGIPVNHQYAKSFAFEDFFNTFVEKSVLEKAKMFSIARPFSDLRLAEMLSHYPQYFDVFFSCNVAMGTDKWCNNCHKCAFIYMALYPFLTRQELVRIFGRQLFDIPTIRRYMIELATASIKPWECVGTKEECQLALYYCLQKSPDMDFTEEPRRSKLEQACGELLEAVAYKNSMSKFLVPHNVPASLVRPLQEVSRSLLEKTTQNWPEISQSQ